MKTRLELVAAFICMAAIVQIKAKGLDIVTRVDYVDLEDDTVYDDLLLQDTEVGSYPVETSDLYTERFETKGFYAILQLLPNSGRSAKNSIPRSSSSDPMFLEFGVVKEVLEQPLLVGTEKTLHYKVLVNTPHGRHLLLATLLEHFEDDVWKEKCKGKLKIFLPEALKSPRQPPPPSDACLLENIMYQGMQVGRQEIMDKFNEFVPPHFVSERFSWYNSTHIEIMNNLVDWVFKHETFSSSYSLLVVIKGKLSKDVFVELVNIVLTGREDTGFILPSSESYMPESFFSSGTLGPLMSKDNSGRDGKQAVQVLWTRSNWTESEWYFREDPVANGHHAAWHRTTGTPSNRWGEYFYYMHNQMTARYEAERLSLGMLPSVEFSPEQWDMEVTDSYFPMLEWWPPRLPGKLHPWYSSYLNGAYDVVRDHILELSPTGYVNGVDTGINALGRGIDRSLHGAGHNAIAYINWNNGWEPGVMASATVSMRDPIFFRWHGFIDTVCRDYKNLLGPYSETDVGFPGVDVIASVQPDRGSPNTFYTYREMTSVSLDSLDSTEPGTELSLQYSRMNHRPFTWKIVVNFNLPVPTPAIVRIFLMPRNDGANNRVRIQMDHFYMNLNPGENQVIRAELDAPHLSKSRWSLGRLQDSLMAGKVDRGQFSWGECGWPRHLNIPRGTESGMDWDLVVIVSQVLPVDLPRIRAWEANSHLAWSYCGVTTGQVPDSRPLGFPFDRDLDVNDLIDGYRTNWAVVPVKIVHQDNVVPQ